MKFIIIRKVLHYVVIGVFKSKLALYWQRAKVTNKNVLQCSKVDMGFTNF